MTNLYLAMGLMPFGLFFDFMDGKVARWRKKSSLMGQELDSLADLVIPPLTLQQQTRNMYSDVNPVDLLRHGPRRVRLRARLPHLPRHRPPLLLRSMRPLSPRTLQRHSRAGAQGCHREEQVL